jgi:predicted dithiol-disulfide oxidoreductase (DUF899 family)
MNMPPVASPQEWEAARQELLVKENDLLLRLLLPRRPGRSSRPPERPRHHARVRLTCPAAGYRALEGTDGLGADPLVHPQTPPYKWWNLHDQYGETV